nr:hypothetical protein [Tanacetum cinerariifolium]
MVANLSEDIQCAGFDTRPPMLDRTDFESWKQHIHLYCLGKDNEVNILKSIDEGPFKLGKFKKTHAEGTEGALNLGPEIFGIKFTKLINDMRNIKMTTPKMQLNSKFIKNMFPEWGRFMTAVKLNRGLKQSNYDQLYAYLKQHEVHANEKKMMLERYNQHAIDPLALVTNVSPHQVFIQNVQGRQNRGQGNHARGTVEAGNGGVQNRVCNANPGQARQIKCGQTNTFNDDVDEAPVQDLALNEDNVFQADQCDAFDFDVDEAPTAQTMFMENLSSADPIYDEAGPSYDSDILFEVQDHDNYVDSVGEYHEVHEMQNNVQPNYVVDSDAEYTSNSNIIPYEQYVKDNAVPVVQKDTLDIAEKTRIGMLEKMKRTLWLDSKIKITPLDYSKENYLATFTPQRQLTPEQIFWITLTGLTEGEIGFKQTKECYLTEIIEKMKCVTMDSVKPKVHAPGMYSIDVEPILPRNKSNREVHLDYLKHLKESVKTLREIIEEAKVEKPLDSSLVSA